MPEFTFFGRWLIAFGVLLVVTGLLFSAGGKVPFIGKLPGDIFIKRDNFTIYFPLATSLLFSLILTIIVNLFTRR